MDLLRLYAYTDSGQRAAAIDFGSADAGAYLVRGWSAPEALESGEVVARAISDQAMLRFAIDQPLARRIRLRCGPRPSQLGQRPVRVIVQLNGRGLRSLRIAELQETTIDLPIDAQRPGENRLSFVQGRGAPRRREKQREDLPDLVCAWARIEVVEPRGRSDGQPQIEREGPRVRSLTLPAGSKVSYFLRLADASTLAFDVAGATTARLSLALARDGAAIDTLWSRSGPAAAVRIDLSKAAHQIVRLDLKVEGPGELEVTRLRLIEPPRPQRRAQPVRRAARPNVILYLIDTLRADHLGSYGYRLPTSPNLDAFAADAMLFTRTAAQASWTKPSAASILTGVYPHRHGAVTLRDSIQPGVATLAEMLRAQGYATAAFVTNVNVEGRFGFSRGFDAYTYLPEEEKRPTVHVGSDTINEAVFSWLQKHGAQPFFAYIHVSDPHAPYRPPTGLAEWFRPANLRSELDGVDQPLRVLTEKPASVTADNLAYVRALYDGEVAFTDQSFGRLVDHLKRLGIYDTTAIIVTADHGEEFHEHGGFEHGHTLFTEQLHVPIIMRLPGFDRGAKVDCLARQIDIVPTLLEALGLPQRADLDGNSLIKATTDECAAKESLAQTSLGGRAEYRSLTTNKWKLIERAAWKPTPPRLYDVVGDPQEHRDIAAQHPIMVGYALQRLRQTGITPRQSAATPPLQPTMDPGTRERLRLLGYAP